MGVYCVLHLHVHFGHVQQCSMNYRNIKSFSLSKTMFCAEEERSGKRCGFKFAVTGVLENAPSNSIYWSETYSVSLQMRCAKSYHYPYTMDLPFCFSDSTSMFCSFPAILLLLILFLVFENAQSFEDCAPFCLLGLGSSFLNFLVSLSSCFLRRSQSIRYCREFLLYLDESWWIAQERNLKSFVLMITPRLEKAVWNRWRIRCISLFP